VDAGDEADRKRPSWQATAGFCISLVGVVISLYNLWEAHYEEPIKAAVNFSEKYIQERDNLNGRFELKLALERPEILNESETADRHKRYVLNLEYMSHLINLGRIDQRYVANNLTCDIVFARRVLDDLKSAHRSIIDAPEISRAGALLADRCI
jgi:hypothetical protein